MGFFDSALKNIVKKAKPLLPVAAMAAAPMMYPKIAAFMGAKGTGAGLGSLLTNYMGKYNALPMLAKAPLSSAATSYGLARLMGQRNPERAALYSALAAVPFSFMKANAYANMIDGEGGISAFDVLKAPGGQDLMSTTFTPKVQGGLDKLSYTDIIRGGPVDSAMMEVEKVLPAMPKVQAIANTKSYPGLGLEDLFRNLEARKGILGNEIAKGSFDMRAFLPLLSGYAGAQPTEEQMKEDMTKEEKDRMAMLYDMMKNPYYSYVPDSFDFIPYASAKGGAVQKYAYGGPVDGPYMDPMPSDDMNINVQEIIQGPGYEAIDDLDIFEEASLTDSDKSELQMLRMLQLVTPNDDPKYNEIELRIKEILDLGETDLSMSAPHPMEGWYDMYNDQINSGEFEGTFDEFMEMIRDSDFDIPMAARGGRIHAKDGLWANIHAKRKRIKGGSGEKMRAPGSKGAPTDKALRESQSTGGISELNLTAGGASNGPGTGTSDSIPAMLSDGEFVMTAKAVENFGGGDRYEGARRMYNMMNALDPNSEKPSEAKTIV
tara:strand:+ start:633 stop:2270 length:1638 start_codon:yes stop_codon:yes gene_type:complete